MTKSISRSLESAAYISLDWHSSTKYAGVCYATRRISLAQRIELTRQVRELTLRNEFLRAGGPSDQLEAALGELLARRLYLEWGLAEVEGLIIDGVPATPSTLIEKGPEKLAEEVADRIIEGLNLSGDERKNS